MHLRLHILPALGSRKVRDISRAAVLQWQAGLKRADGRPGAPASGTINLVRANAAPAFRHAVAIEYQTRTNIYPDIYVLSASEGVHQVAAGKLVG